MYICIYICIYIYMYICIYICIYIYIYIYIYIIFVLFWTPSGSWKESYEVGSVCPFVHPSVWAFSWN